MRGGGLAQWKQTLADWPWGGQGRQKKSFKPPRAGSGYFLYESGQSQPQRALSAWQCSANLSIASSAFRFVSSSWYPTVFVAAQWRRVWIRPWHPYLYKLCLHLVLFNVKQHAEFTESGGFSICQGMHPFKRQEFACCAANLRDAFRPRRPLSQGLQNQTYWT